MSEYKTPLRQTWKDAEGRLHRDWDLPALIYLDGSREWYHHGVRHRDGDLPAVELANGHGGYFAWYKHGQRHRDGDLPAVMYGFAKEWYQHGKLHRDGTMPAIIFADGTQQWYVHGVRQSDADRAATRRWSPLRAAFVGAVAMCAPCTT